MQAYMRLYHPVEDKTNGIRGYNFKAILVSPVGYVRLDGPPLQVGSSDPPSSTDVKRPTVAADPTALAAKMQDIVVDLVIKCTVANGADEARKFYASITSIAFDERGAVSAVSGDPQHWLVQYFNSKLKAAKTPEIPVPQPSLHTPAAGADQFGDGVVHPLGAKCFVSIPRRSGRHTCKTSRGAPPI